MCADRLFIMSWYTKAEKTLLPRRELMLMTEHWKLLDDLSWWRQSTCSGYKLAVIGDIDESGCLLPRTPCRTASSKSTRCRTGSSGFVGDVVSTVSCAYTQIYRLTGHNTSHQQLTKKESKLIGEIYSSFKAVYCALYEFTSICSVDWLVFVTYLYSWPVTRCLSCTGRDWRQATVQWTSPRADSSFRQLSDRVVCVRVSYNTLFNIIIGLFIFRK